jgi:hypothetical protein
MAAQTSTTDGELIPPEECTTEPRSATFLSDLIATPAAVETPEPITEIPTGDPPDSETAEAITSAIRQMIACSNSGELLRALAIYSDDYLRRTLNPSGEMTAEDALTLSGQAATPIALTEDQMIRLISIDQMTLQDDGSVSVLVVTDGGPIDPDGFTTDLFIWREVDGTWLADEAVANADLLFPE